MAARGRELANLVQQYEQRFSEQHHGERRPISNAFGQWESAARHEHRRLEFVGALSPDPPDGRYFLAGVITGNDLRLRAGHLRFS